MAFARHQRWIGSACRVRACHCPYLPHKGQGGHPACTLEAFALFELVHITVFEHNSYRMSLYILLSLLYCTEKTKYIYLT
ncbi:hypothetical protein BRADI_5g12385v3 [Brachypodium distachyon]|uniref:Uncharacterized protein n=1 Tax=Brachypodium distachyon TaxID=15368 RepID=A0A2K2CGS1_BRADI|nr:hypothetical protein BRADI_5g12385v3 [Brachypodium distachyon]